MDQLIYLMSGLLTLTGSLGAVYLTNRAHDRRLKLQLAHDLELKKRDREMSLRKEVYLEAAEAMSAGLITLGRFGNFEVADDKLSEDYVSKLPSVQKIHVIAKEETVEALVKFSGELAATMLRLLTKRYPLVWQAQQMKFLQTQIDGALKDQSRMLQLMEQHNLDGAKDQEKWDTIQRNFDYAKGKFDELQKQSADLGTTLYPKQLQFMEECIREGSKLSRLLVPVVVSIRRELELPLDETKYSKLMEEAAVKGEQSVKEFTGQLLSLISSKLNRHEGAG